MACRASGVRDCENDVAGFFVVEDTGGDVGERGHRSCRWEVFGAFGDVVYEGRDVIRVPAKSWLAQVIPQTKAHYL